MLDRSTAPSFTRSTHFDLIQPRVVTLPNGISMYTLHGGTQPVIKVELVLKAGRWYETTWGASYFSSKLLSKGTSGKTSFQIAQMFDHYGAHLDVSPGMDVVSIALYTLTKNLQPTLQLLRELLEDSIFPEKELEQLKSIYLQNLKVNNEKTSFHASKLFRKSLFGDHHPYGRELDAADVQPLSQTTVASHFATFGHDTTIFVSGQVDAAAERTLHDAFDSILYTPVPAKSIAAAQATPFRDHVAKEGSVQSSIRMGKRTVGRTHPDYPLVLFISHILGGYFGSRLMRNIREEKGLTYGIHASLHTLLNDNHMVIGADVNNENVVLTFNEIRGELKRLRTERIDDEELEVARNHFIGGLQSEITTPFAHADKIKNIFLFGLPANFYDTLIARIDGATPEQLIQLGEQYFSEDSFFEISVG